MAIPYKLFSILVPIFCGGELGEANWGKYVKIANIEMRLDEALVQAIHCKI